MATSALSSSVRFLSGGRKVAMPQGNHHLMVGGGVEVRKGERVVRELVEYPTGGRALLPSRTTGYCASRAKVAQ